MGIPVVSTIYGYVHGQKSQVAHGLSHPRGQLDVARLVAILWQAKHLIHHLVEGRGLRDLEPFESDGHLEFGDRRIRGTLDFDSVQGFEAQSGSPMSRSPKVLQFYLSPE